MPTASDELRDRMAEYYGDRIDDSGPLQFLLACGWTEFNGILGPPMALAELPDKQWLSALFLRDEWDYDVCCSHKGAA